MNHIFKVTFGDGSAIFIAAVAAHFASYKATDLVSRYCGYVPTVIAIERMPS